MKRAILPSALTISLLLVGCTKKAQDSQPTQPQTQVTSQTASGSKVGVSPVTQDTPQAVVAGKEMPVGLASLVGRTPSAQPQSQGALQPEKVSPQNELQKTPTSTPPQTITEVISTPTCFKLEFNHPKTAGHNSDESCSQHKNLLKLGHTQYNKKSVCVRVNNTPVKFEIHPKNSDQLLVGAVAGPDSKISVSYCLQENLCKEDCVVPRDEFMDALSGGISEDGKAIAWDDSQEGSETAQKTKSLEKTMKRELAALNEGSEAADGSAESSSDGLALFRGWKVEKENAPSCQAGFKKEVRTAKVPAKNSAQVVPHTKNGAL
jgi:hypothetical protein